MAHDFKEMMSKEIEIALKASQDKIDCTAEKVENIGYSLPLRPLFPMKSKIVNRLENR